MNIDNIRDRDHAEYYRDDAAMTAEVDFMRFGVLMRFEVDVTYLRLNFTGEVVVTGINDIWVAGVFDKGYDGADYRDGKPRLFNIKVNIDDLTDEEIDLIKAAAASDIEYHLERARD
jgi:hypothetical protein